MTTDHYLQIRCARCGAQELRLIEVAFYCYSSMQSPHIEDVLNLRDAQLGHGRTECSRCGDTAPLRLESGELPGIVPVPRWVQERR